MEDYTKLRIIGTGSFGTVWLVRSTEKHRNYVLKEIPLSMVDERERGFVLNEVKVLSQLRHINIIRYKEAFLSNGFLCISMEYAHEGDLSDRIRKQNGQMLFKEQIFDWFVQLCLALKYIHGMNILHRDIKCQNIFISKDNVIKLGDFGIACVLQSTLDHAQTVIGTPYYLSPEICRRQPYNHKSDIWALGCVLYEMITLRHPFESPDFPQLILKILRGDYTPIPKNHGTLLQDLVSILLRVEPSERPSAKQILHIPAMQAYVNAILTRGRTQRAESASCGEGLHARKGDAWRAPDVVPLEDARKQRRRNHSEVEVWENVQEESETFSKDVQREPKTASEAVACSEANQNRKKRNSSGDFLRAETPTKKLKVCQEKHFVDVLESYKENHNPVQRAPPKSRSYSTSIVRESAERRPLAPLNRRQVRLRETFDVIPEQKHVLQDTYSKTSSCRGYMESNTTSSNAEACENQANYFGRKTCDGKPSGASILKWNKTKDFLQVLFGGSGMVFCSASPRISLKEYVEAMKSSLEDSLGVEMFNALDKYLHNDVATDLSTGVDVCGTMFEALGEERIVFVPLMLQYIQCKKSLAE